MDRFVLGEQNVRIQAIELAEVVAENLERLTKIADASGLWPSVVQAAPDDLL